MADRKISDLTALTTPASGDYLPIIDISEAAAASKNKRVTIQSLFQGIPVNVGIGTTAPAEKLTVSTGTDADAGNISIGLGAVTAGSSRRAVLTKNTTSPFEVTLEASSGGTSVATIFKSSGTNETARIDGSGRLLVGTSSAGGALTRTIELHGAGTGISQPAYQVYAYPGDFAVNTGYFQFCRSRGSSVGTKTIVASGDRLGAIRWSGANGTEYDIAAEIYAEVDGTPGASGDMPGRIVLSTTSDGAATSTERLRITSAGVLQIADAGNITVGTTTGTKIGTATTQKLGFYNATPVVQPAAVADATDAASVITQLNDLLAKLRTLGIIAT